MLWPHRLSNQRRLVHGALAPHHPAIIANSLHNVGPLESTFLLSAFLSYELSVANKHSRIVIMLSCRKAKNAINVPQDNKMKNIHKTLMRYINSTYHGKQIASI